MFHHLLSTFTAAADVKIDWNASVGWVWDGVGMGVGWCRMGVGRCGMVWFGLGCRVVGVGVGWFEWVWLGMSG